MYDFMRFLPEFNLAEFDFNIPKYGESFRAWQQDWAAPFSLSPAPPEAGVVGGVFELSSLLAANGGDGSAGFVLNGITAGDLSGISVSDAGDINGDGFDDILIGALFAGPNGNSEAGESYVVFGRDDSATPFSASFDLSTLNGTNGFVINGIDSFDRSGVFVSSAGDFNGDGFDDILIGASGADPNGNNAAGESYIVFGRDDSVTPFAAMLNLSALDGTNGFVINGIDGDDLSGRYVSSAGDFNGDGFDDILIGASGANPNGNSEAGESYIVFGRDDSVTPFASSFDPSTLDGTNGFIISGIDSDDFSGISVSSAGDINGDGFDDILIGAVGADNGVDLSVGETYLVFGRDDSTTPFAASLDLSSLNGTNGFIITGIDPFGFSGISVSSAGDINGDGFDDILIGADTVDNGLDVDVGESYVIFGRDDSVTPFAATLDLSTLNGTNGFAILGVAEEDNSGRSVSNAGDINGDGYDDILIGAYGISTGSGFNVGGAYVIFGRDDSVTPFASSLDLSTLNGTDGFFIAGIDLNDAAGWSVSAAGDVNGDGFDDILVGAQGGDPIGDTDAGESYIIFGSSDFGMPPSSIDGTPGDDTLVGTAGNDTINGFGGNDRLLGKDGDDTINGDAGNDFLTGRAGDDDLFGGADDDILRGDAGADDLDGGAGTDTASYRSATALVTISGGAGTGGDAAGDTYTSIERWWLSDFADVVTGTAADEIYFGFAGDDTIDGGAGVDILVGGAGMDTLNGGAGDDLVFGGDDNDTLSGGNGRDYILGGNGNDRIEGGSGNDHLNGNAGADVYIINENSFNTDYILGWEDGTDMIEIGLNVSNTADFSDLTVTQSGANVLVTFNDPAVKGRILILGETASNIDAADFDFLAPPPGSESDDGFAGIEAVQTPFDNFAGDWAFAWFEAELDFGIYL